MYVFKYSIKGDLNMKHILLAVTGVSQPTKQLI